MIALNLKLRIAAAIALLCIAIVSALGIALYLASEEMEDALVEQIVGEEIEFLIQRHRADPGYAQAPGPNLQYYVVRTPDDAARLPPALRDLGPGQHEIDIGGGMGERHVAVRKTGGTRFIVAYDVGPHYDRERQFKALIMLAIATVALVALAVGYWLAGALTRQLTDLAQRVGELGPGTPREPMASPEQDSEVAALARALDQYQARINGLIAREQEFTANASHELRTPLTAIRTSCELLSSDPQLPLKTRERITRIDEAAERMTSQIELLLFLAREKTPADREPVALLECVKDAAEPYRAELGRKGVVFDVQVPPDATVSTDRRALQIVLANLIRNAARHTQQGRVLVSYTGQRLTVTDSGSGMPEDQLPRIFERYYTSGERTDGLGLGLAIVKRICDQFGWKIEVSSRINAGSAFTVTLA